MMRMVSVTSRSDEKRFIRFAVTLYKNDPFWIRPLDADIEAVFDPEKNKTFFVLRLCYDEADLLSIEPSVHVERLV